MLKFIIFFSLYQFLVKKAHSRVRTNRLDNFIGPSSYGEIFINGCLLKVLSLHLSLLVTKDEGTLSETNLNRHASNSRNPVRVSHFLDRAFLSLPVIEILLLRDFQQAKLNTRLLFNR